MQLLTNHIGYETNGPKSAVLLATTALTQPISGHIVCTQTQKVKYRFSISSSDQVAHWHQGYFAEITFTDFTEEGEFILVIEGAMSHSFVIKTNLLMAHTFSDVMHYFKSQRCGGVFDKQDKQAPLLNSNETVDVHGGWYDASGDVSKYLSHLSYANYLNPQQIPMVVWNMLKGLELTQNLSDFAAFSRTRLTEEALFGADFLVRMQNPAGFFYMIVFDKWSKDINQRDICAYATQEGHKSDDYQAGFRQGGGVSIAALAAASQLTLDGEFTREEYLAAATKGYWHLKENNLSYLNNGEENIIDEYCALLAVIELFKATQENSFLIEARIWADKLSARQQSDDNFSHFWSATDNGERPYFHAAEAGLPVIALSQYLEIETDNSRKAHTQLVINQAVEFELTISSETFNPFGYPRQYVKAVNGQKRSAFFVAHDNESGYWWQGENARLGSLASMSYLVLPHLTSNELKQRLTSFAQHNLNWVLGLNPYDMCMLDGHGHNNPDYLPHLGFFNAKGGVCNGITGGFEDEEDIAFNPAPHGDDMLQNWRWGEQWIPHGAWYLLAIMSQSAYYSEQGA
ncbi:glycoside hydrolase family 9 protein [Aliivibrio fischeri]|uniref:glycoside hydrolase family 9 protein n=1 Tax=Aliivibrio fischeri TaxID=668 RepID=UPI0002F7238C|nr:glycoside hydrolase family 9 protein [Aliivibrio fischeri]OEE16637.1 chitobiase [Aliivibrio fischeri ZF-211]